MEQEIRMISEKRASRQQLLIILFVDPNPLIDWLEVGLAKI